jgi:hypothetical protein
VRSKWKIIGIVAYVIFLCATFFLGFVIYQIRSLPGMLASYKMIILGFSILLTLIFFIKTYFHKRIEFRYIALGLLPVLISTLFAFWDRITVYPDTSNELVIEAHYMQYACGDWVDEMQVTKISDTTHNWLIGRDIDPVFYLGASEVGDMFYSDDTTYRIYNRDIRMKGYISNSSNSGCDNTSPRFWITHQEKLDGSIFKRDGNNKL